jgi:NADH-quinone oxidoreductase subunit M
MSGSITLLVVGPILIGFILYALPKGADTAAKWIGVGVAGIACIFTLLNPGAGDDSLHWLSRPFDAAFHFGFSPISYWIVVLLQIATFSALVALRANRLREYTAQMLVLLGAMSGVFLAKDLLLFALFWDLMLVPVFLLMIGWGSPVAGPRRRGTAAWRYLIYNLAGGLCLLLATAAYGITHGTTDVIGAANAAPVADAIGSWIFAGFAFAFLVKTPVFPFHTWMPPTYGELPPPVVAVVGSVQSKAGLYGFIVIGLPLLGTQMRAAAPLIVALGLISLLYGALVSLTQVDAKRIVAYSSLSHLGLMLIAIFSFDPLAIGGAVVYIVAHGLFSAALFLTLGYVEAREDTRSLQRLGGLAYDNPRLGGALTFAALAALGLPGLAGFAGELLILTGLYHAGYGIVALIALVPIVIAAAYMLRLFQGIMNGPKVADLPERRDLSWIEGLALAPLVIGFVLLGVDPGPVAGIAADAARVLSAGTARGAVSTISQPSPAAGESSYAVASSIR